MNTEDRELLELSAKAIGVKLEIAPAWGGGFACRANGYYWNPLTSDSDAFRLSVQLGLDIEFWTKRVYAGPRESGKHAADVKDSQDLFCAARLAIVLSAAEIGRAMP